MGDVLQTVESPKFNDLGVPTPKLRYPTQGRDIMGLKIALFFMARNSKTGS